PAQSYSSGQTGPEISRLPSHLVVQRPSSSRTGRSSIRSSARTKRGVQYEPSILSVESEQRLADSLMSLRFEIKDMGERIEYLLDLRKRLSHRQKRVNPDEYKQALNSPSMLILHEEYKNASHYRDQCRDAVKQRMAEYHKEYHLTPEEVLMEVYALQETWVRAAVNAAEQRLNYLQQFPFAYQDKEAIRGHIIAANDAMNSAVKALEEVEYNKRINMAHKTSPNSDMLFEKGNHHAVENSIVLVYGLHDVTPQDIQRACDTATETYAMKILNWPNGRPEKPEIFRVENRDQELKDLDNCIERFVGHLHDVFEAPPPKDLPTYPHAFVVMDKNCLGEDATATMVLAHKPEDEWRVQHCSVPIEVELGLAVESLRLGDVTETDMLDQFTN
ncbi:unnamed protein product, partial [Fusarium fujikuroi]